MPDFSMLDWFSDDASQAGYGLSVLSLMPGLRLSVSTFGIGRHRFTFFGSDERAAGWRRHLERCARDYEVRQSIRSKGRAA